MSDRSIVKTLMIATVLVLAVASIAEAQDSAAASARQTSAPHGASSTDESHGIPCLFDPERGEVPDCLHQSREGRLSVAPQIVKQLDFDAYGLAAVRSPEGWMYVNRSGKVVVASVTVMDNGADSFHDGLVRIVRNGKYGFANRTGRIVIAPIYDGAMDFENGTATVCKSCESKPVGEYRMFSGGEWFQINTKGMVLRRLPAQP